MTLTIHRGTRQIGGVVAEIATARHKVFIDIGSNLRETDAPLLPIDGLTAGSGADSALLLTHYHGDHIGELPRVLPEVPVFMGATAKQIQLNIENRLSRIPDDEAEAAKHRRLAAITESIQTFDIGRPKRFGDITVTPLRVDHSAFDAYMFVIEGEGKRILYTGDFRFHGPRGPRSLRALEKYAVNIDYLVCEGSTVARPDSTKRPMSECELQAVATEYMRKHKYVFVLCASTNFDRLFSLYHAAQKTNRRFICDKYQKEQMAVVAEAMPESGFYRIDEGNAYRTIFGYDFYKPDIMAKIKEFGDDTGFVMPIRQGDKYAQFMKEYRDKDYLVLYSMWDGYLDARNPAFKKDLAEFLKQYRYEKLHTSGHAYPADIKELFERINPKTGVIPMHTDSPENFAGLIPADKVIRLRDGEKLAL